MPRDLDISDVDLSQGEQRIGDQGETMREMISNTYRCRSRAEEDFFPCSLHCVVSRAPACSRGARYRVEWRRSRAGPMPMPVKAARTAEVSSRP